MIPTITVFLISICGLGFSASDYFRKLALNNLDARILLLIFVSGQIPLLGLWFILSNNYHINITQHFIQSEYGYCGNTGVNL